MGFFISMKQKLVIFFLALSGTCSLQSQSDIAAIEARIKQVENNLLLGPFEPVGAPGVNLEERMRHYKIKGLSIAVIDNYKIDWARAYGYADSAEGRKVTPETPFEPGSISKSLNALAVLKLVQDGKLDLDTDINTYLKSWKFPYDKKSKEKKITLRQILSHSAGLSQHGFPGYYYGDTLPTIQQILDGKRPANTEPVRSLFEPGTKYQYSGGGSMISQLIVMDITGKPYDEFLKETVFGPLNMTNSFFTQPPSPEWKGKLATGYDRNGNEIKGKYPLLLEQAAGGYWGTPTDLCKFIIEIEKSLNGESNKVLNKKMTEQMLSPVIKDGEMALGLGVFLPPGKETKYFQHGAGNQGFRGTYYGSFEGGKGVVIFINGEDGQILNEVVGSVAKVYGWKDMGKTEKRKYVEVPDSVISKYAGVYKQDNVFASIVKTADGYMYYTSNKYWKMYFTSDTSFFNRESSSEKYFSKGKDGKYQLERVVNGKKQAPAKKIELRKLPAEKMKAMCGTYKLDQPLDIKLIEDELYLCFDQYKWKMLFYTDDEFYLNEVPGCYFRFWYKGKAAAGFEQFGDENKKAKKLK